MAALAGYPPPVTAAAAAVPADAAGGGLAEGLVSAVAGGAGVGPEQDVAAYLRQSLLPVLGPAIEQLLHHIHDSGELQRALKELAAAEKQRSQRKSAQAADAAIDRASKEAAEDAAKRDSSSLEEAASSSEKDGSPRSARPRRNSRGDASARPGSKGRQEPAQEEEAELFDPLVWLSERLRESAAGPTELYRERIEQRVIQHISESEKAILEGNEEEGSAAVASPVPPKPPGEEEPAASAQGGQGAGPL